MMTITVINSVNEKPLLFIIGIPAIGRFDGIYTNNVAPLREKRHWETPKPRAKNTAAGSNPTAASFISSITSQSVGWF